MRLRIPLIAALIGLSALVYPVASDAFSPIRLRGIDLPTALTMHDIRRQLENEAQGWPDLQPPLTHIRTIVIDPGHGGQNSGATGVAQVKEKYLTIELAYVLRDMIRANHPDVHVLMTRYWDRDVALEDRIHFANQAGADLFLSLHYNAAVHDRAIGFETFFLKSSEATPGASQQVGPALATSAAGFTDLEDKLDPIPSVTTHNEVIVSMQRDLDRQTQQIYSQIYAQTVQDRLQAHLASVNRGVKQANFAVLRGARMPAVVIEAGFLTHPVEGMISVTDEHRKQVATAILHSIAEFDRQIREVEAH